MRLLYPGLGLRLRRHTRSPAKTGNPISKSHFRKFSRNVVCETAEFQRITQILGQPLDDGHAYDRCLWSAPDHGLSPDRTPGLHILPFLFLFIPSMTYTLPVSHHSSKKLKKLQSAASCSTLMKIASDRCGSFGALIATGDTILIECGGRAYGAAPHSFRAEGYGILAILRLLFHIRYFYVLSCRQARFWFYCDSESLLKRIEASRKLKRTISRHYFFSEVHVEMQILASIQLLASVVELEHVDRTRMQSTQAGLSRGRPSSTSAAMKSLQHMSRRPTRLFRRCPSSLQVKFPFPLAHTPLHTTSRPNYGLSRDYPACAHTWHITMSGRHQPSLT
jgi:hypothetical protein